MMVRLYDRAFVARLRRAVRERVKNSGKKSAGGKWWKGRGARGGSIGLLYLMFLALNVGRLRANEMANQEEGKQILLCSLSLVLAGAALGQAQKLWRKLTLEGERMVLLFYPIEDRDFYSWATLRFAARTTWVLLAAGGIYFLTTSAGGTGEWILRAAAPILEWLVVLSAAFALVPHLYKYPRWLPLGMYAAGLLLLFAPLQYATTMEPLGWALPTGWVHWLMMNRATKGWAAGICVALVPMAGALSWWLWKRLEQVYCILQQPVHEAADTATAPVTNKPNETPLDLPRANPEEEKLEAELAEELEGEATLPMQAAWRKQRLANLSGDVVQYVLEGSWIQGWDWKALGWIEWMAGWCLNSREKEEAQFLLGPRVPKWSGRWKIAVIATAVAFAAMLPGIGPSNLVAVLAFAVSIGAGLPLLGGQWPATSHGRISGKFSPIFSCYPLSYWTAGWTMWKLNAVRILAWIPLGMMLGILGARSGHMDLAQGCWLVGRGILLLLGLMPILLAGKFSKGTNDTVNLRWSTIPVIGIAMVVLIVEVIFGSAAMMAGGEAAPCGAIAAVAATASGAWALYGVYYERGRADLLRDQP
jgi:hypothetical protein